MRWYDRVEQLMQERGWTQYDLADASGFSQPHINRLLNQEELPVNRALKKLASAFNVPVEYFTTGVHRVSNSLDIPLLTPEQVTDWLDRPDTLRGKVVDWVSVSRSCSDKTYALTVTGSDMSTPQCVHNYPLGSIIIVDPGKAMEPGHRVVCRLPDDRVIFRELQLSAGEYYLAALNPSFPLIPLGPGFRYLGGITCTIIQES